VQVLRPAAGAGHEDELGRRGLSRGGEREPILPDLLDRRFEGTTRPFLGHGWVVILKEQLSAPGEQLNPEQAVRVRADVAPISAGIIGTTLLRRAVGLGLSGNDSFIAFSSDLPRMEPVRSARSMTATRCSGAIRTKAPKPLMTPPWWSTRTPRYSVMKRPCLYLAPS
jgi:hypothetical protein